MYVYVCSLKRKTRERVRAFERNSGGEWGGDEREIFWCVSATEAEVNAIGKARVRVKIK